MAMPVKGGNPAITAVDAAALVVSLRTEVLANGFRHRCRQQEHQLPTSQLPAPRRQTQEHLPRRLSTIRYCDFYTRCEIDDIDRSFFDYIARGAPYGPDDGTIVPWAVAASLPFAPEIVLSVIRNLQDAYPLACGKYSFRCGINSVNPNYPICSEADVPWISNYHFGTNLGPVVMMCENFRTGLLWRLMRANPHIKSGLRRAGFTNGWL